MIVEPSGPWPVKADLRRVIAHGNRGQRERSSSGLWTSDGHRADAIAKRFDGAKDLAFGLFQTPWLLNGVFTFQGTGDIRGGLSHERQQHGLELLPRNDVIEIDHRQHPASSRYRHRNYLHVRS